MYTYSIIVPHKDCCDLLNRGLHSIPNRADIQVIVVDDNSQNVASLHDLEHVFNDRFQFIYTTEGKGAGYARNVGLEKAVGKWLLFMDADDYFPDTAFSVFDEYIDSHADIVIFKHKSVFSDTGEDAIRSDSRNTFIDLYLKDNNSQNEARLRYSNDVPWAKMVRKEMIDKFNIRFDEVPASNDTMFSLMAGYRAKTILADKRAAYCVTVRSGSITKTKSVERYFSDHCVALRKNKFVREIGHPECQEVILSRILVVAIKYGFKQFMRFMKEVKRYKGRLLFGLTLKRRY